MMSDTCSGDVAVCCSGSYQPNASKVDQLFRSSKGPGDKQFKVTLGYIWMNKQTQPMVECKTPSPVKKKDGAQADTPAKNEAAAAAHQKRGMAAAQDVQQYHMAADKCTMCMRSKPRLSSGSSHSMVIHDITKIDHRTKCVPSISPDDKRIILADTQTSADCTSIEGYSGGKENRQLVGARKRQKVFSP